MSTPKEFSARTFTARLPVLNQATFAGFLASKAQELSTSSGIAATFVVAVPRGKQREGEMVYVQCVSWGGIAQALLATPHTGAPVIVSGALASRQLSKDLHVRVSALQFLETPNVP